MAGMLYTLLFVWSVGFGYGFWWSKIAGPEKTKAELNQNVRSLNNQMDQALIRLTDISTAINDAVARGTAERDREREHGNTCGVASQPGEGPLMRRRDAINSELTTLGQSVEQSWLGPLRTELSGAPSTPASADPPVEGAPAPVAAGLRQDLVQTLERAPRLRQNQRRDEFQRVWDRAGDLARRVQASTESAGMRYATQMRQLADEVSDPDQSKSTFCLDPSLASSLRRAAEQAQAPIALEVGEFEFNEGAQATAHAVRQLWGNFYYWLVGLFSMDAAAQTAAPADLSEIAAENIEQTISQRPESFEGNDVFALVAAIGVDLGILVLTLIRPQPPLPWLDAQTGLTPSARRRLRRQVGRRVEPRPADFSGTDAADFLETCVIREGVKYYLASPNPNYPWPDGQLRRYARTVFNLVIGLDEALQGRPRFGMERLREQARLQLSRLLPGGENAFEQKLPGLDIEIYKIDHRSLDEILATVRERVAGRVFEDTPAPVFTPPPPVQEPSGPVTPRARPNIFDALRGMSGRRDQAPEPEPAPAAESYGAQGPIDADDVREELRNDVGRIGESEDADTHEVVRREPSNEFLAGQVIEVIEPGERNGGQIIRRARVVISTGPRDPVDA
jgi:hypothetical protein